MKKKINNNLAGVIFLLIIFGFMLYDFVLPDITFSENENRMLAKKPDFTAEKLMSGKFGNEYETWLTDQFPLRNQWIAVKTTAERAIGRTDSNGVYFGKDDYLFGVFENKETENISYICEFANRMEELLGAGHSKVMAVPTSSLVLKDKLPSFVPEDGQEALLQEFKDNLKEGIYVDVRKALSNHEDEYIYYRTDHHWTTMGAYYAYQAWADSVGFEPVSASEKLLEPVTNEFLGTLQSKVSVKRNPDTIYVYRPEVSFEYEVTYNLGERTTDTFYETSYLEKKDKYGMFFDGNQPVTQIRRKEGGKGKLLIVKDSFAHCFAPFAAEQFNEVHMVDLRYFRMPLSQYIEEQGITDVLVLYNTDNIVKDRNLFQIVK